MVQWTPNQTPGFPEPGEGSKPEEQPRVKRRRSQGPRTSVPPAVPPTSAGMSRSKRTPGPFEAVATPSSTSSSPSSSTSWHTGSLPPAPRDVPPTSRPPTSKPLAPGTTLALGPDAPGPPNAARDVPRLPYRGAVSPQATPGCFQYLHPSTTPQASTAHSSPSPHPSPTATLTAQDITALAARFTNKPVPRGYEQEARATLEASQSEPAVRHALASLRSLYKTLEDHGHEFPHGRLAVPTVYHGLQEYHNAIVNLTDKLSVMDRRSCEVALVCCRLFISIGTMQRDYVSVAEHYIRGMRIMHEAATRPYLDARGNVIPTQNGEFPKIDEFMIKIFMSPDRLSPACTAAIRALPSHRKLTQREWMRVAQLARCEVRAARLKSRLLIISELCLQHFDNVARLRPGADAGRVVVEREVLLKMLGDIRIEGRDGEGDLGPYHGRFHLLYHCALKIAVSLTLWAPTVDIGGLQGVFGMVAEVAKLVI